MILNLVQNLESAINSYAFDFKERLKQGLRVVPTFAPSLPLLGPYGLFKGALDRFHSKLVRPYGNVADVNKNLSNHFSVWTKRRTGGILKQARQLRVLYAKFVAGIFGAKEHQNLFIQRALVHTTSLNYTRISFPCSDNRVQLWIPPWVEQGTPHPLQNIIAAPPQEEKRRLKAINQDEIEAAHDVLLPDEDEDEFEQRNLDADAEEKRVGLTGETLQRQARQVSGLRHELPQAVAQPFAPQKRKEPNRVNLFNLEKPMGLFEPKEFALNFRRPGRPKNQGRNKNIRAALGPIRLCDGERDSLCYLTSPTIDPPLLFCQNTSQRCVICTLRIKDFRTYQVSSVCVAIDETTEQ